MKKAESLRLITGRQTAFSAVRRLL